jgi:predicted transcriptional regulator
MPSPILTLRVSPELHRRLELLADRTKRSKSFLANEAIDAYLARELEIVEGIHRSLEDVRAGRVIPHEEAMRRVDRFIAAAKAKRASKAKAKAARR